MLVAVTPNGEERVKDCWEYDLVDLRDTMEVATGKFLLTLTRPTPKPTAGGPKKCWNWAREPPQRQRQRRTALTAITR